MTLYQVGKWKDILVPEMNINFTIKVKIFFWMIICRVYRCLKICSYKHWE